MRKGFTLIELLMVIGIISILSGILYPVSLKVREKARQSSCLSNVRQLTLACRQYVDDYDGRLPEAAPEIGQYGAWVFRPSGFNYQLKGGALEPYVRSEQILVCPSSPEGGLGYGVGLAFPGNLRSYSAGMRLVGESEDGRPALAWSQAIPHAGGSNVGYVDGHAKWWRRLEGIEMSNPFFTGEVTHYPVRDN